MKKLIVLLAIAIVLFTACEPTAGGGGGSSIPPITFGKFAENGSEFLWAYEDENNPGAPVQLSYVNLDSYGLSEQDIIEIFVSYGDKTNINYDPAYPYIFGFNFSSTTSFEKSSFDNIKLEKNVGGPFEDTLEYSGTADFSDGRYYFGIYWTIGQSFFDNIKNSNSITVTISNSNNNSITPIVCTLPSKFSETLRNYF